MFPFGKSAQQKRIDADAVVIANLTLKLEEQTEALAKERKDSREKGRLASELLGERDAARIERDTAQQERDAYRTDALKYRNSQAPNQRRRMEALNKAAKAAADFGPGKPTNGEQAPKPNGTAAAVQGVARG